MRSKEYMSLIKMLEYIDRALKYTKGYEFKQFCQDEKTKDATVLVLSQLGELVKNISKETMQTYSNIEWIVIKNLRNKIVHDYDGINYNLIWDILQNDLPVLKSDIQDIINKESN